jgi:hypothetical protein
MSLDFSGLNNIARNMVIKEFPEMPVDAPESPKTGSNEIDSIEIPLDALNGLKNENREPVDGIALIKLRRQQEDHEQIQEAYKAYQDNIKRSGELRAEILRGIKSGEPTPTLLLKAVECISNMTGDKLFYTQAEKDIKAIYGEAFLSGESLELELVEVEERLSMLKKACKREGIDEGDKERITIAIKSHEKRQETIKALIERAEENTLKRVI